MTTTGRATRTATAAAALAAVLTACATPGPAPVATPPVTTVAWQLDDLAQDPETGRYYSTCEDPANSRHELEAWLTEQQAADHQEGGPCPTDDIRTPEYVQQDETADAERDKIKIIKPAQPATSGTTPGTPGGTKPGTGTARGTIPGTTGGTTGGTKPGTGTAGGTKSGGTKTDTSGGTRSGSSGTRR